MAEVMDEERHFPDQVDGVDIVSLLPKVVLCESVLAIAHQAQHL